MDIVLVCCWWLVKGVARPPMLCVAQNHRLQAHRHCCLTWIFCVKWNMRDDSLNSVDWPQACYKERKFFSVFLSLTVNMQLSRKKPAS